ncbi:MAG: sigma-54-dependent Fis family transcriptional regulator [Deltaproteobacteria bacterium]|nr:sigma-54-dependent Fis family transcriptional regulator [Deltaproteobacteria bacterium]MBW1872796.1 sigma-54-dependent Fis family transcriptional regulator [Deltaproteobacteria bacterium]
MNATILVADDEQNIRRVLSATLAKEGHEVITARDGEEAIARLSKGNIHVVVTDLKMPKADGLQVLAYVQRNLPQVPVIIITAHGTVDNAVHALKSGAFDYITKPFEKSDLINIIAKAVKTENLARQDFHPPPTEPGRYRIIGQSQKMTAVYEIIEKVAETPSTVLITGESGTGKELIAAALHYNSSRKKRPYIKINCAAIPRELMESELFGYEKGAFTGAVGSKPGRFELADSGTLFLDEIAEVPIDMQVKMLRAIQEAEFERVGGVQTIRVDVRLVVATNRDLQKEVEVGNFREDLFYRLNVVPIHLPPLRERKDDIPLLVKHFIEKFNTKLDRSVKEISKDALNLVVNYRWPGNIRELENMVERGILFTDGPTIDVADLPAELVERSHLAPSAATIDEDTSMKDIVKQATAELEKDLIVKALKETNGNVTRAAKRLKISRKSLQNKMKEFGLRETE